MSVYTYDAKTSTTTVKGRYLTGFAEGSMVEWSKNEDNFVAKVDAQGNVAVAKRNNTLGTITVNLDQTSPDVSFLKQLANTGEIVPIWVQAGGDTKEKIGGTQAMVTKTPDGSLGDETESRSFDFVVFDYTDQ